MKRVQVVSMLIAVLICTILVFVEGADPVNLVFSKNQQLQVEELFKKRDLISTYLDTINSDLAEAITSRDLASQLSFAQDAAGKDFITKIDGVTAQDVDQFASSFSLQYQEMVNYTNTLQLKKKIILESIKVLDTQIIAQYNNGIRMNRFASTEMGTVALLANNTLLFIGKFETTYRNAGFNSADLTARVIKTVGFVDMSPIAGKTVVDVQAVATYNFVILTSDGQVWGWGYNYDNTLGANVAGTINIMKNPDFGAVIPSPVIKKIKCNDNFYGCYMITTDGRLLFMGAFEYTAIVEHWTRPRVLSTIVDGLNHGVVDVAIATLTSVPKSICFISNINSLIYCTGDNSLGQLGDLTTTSRIPGASTGTGSPVFTWKQVSSDVKFVKILGGSQYFMALSTEGKLYSWGTGDFRLGRESKIVPYHMPAKVPTPFMIRNVCLSPSKTTTYVTDFKDNVYVIGSYYGEDLTQFYKVAVLGDRTFPEIICGDSGTFLIPSSSTSSIWATGKNTNYQLGVDAANTYNYFFEASNVPKPYNV
ncbi:predicted protein [Naegleria gruberi]|uniref:Predicted protein n=1 Tax=Naegleria gruberi TaxID=5762 RepID=D2VHX7_NAEGR|nr:uncharacterized protein NAEGRDRAFT_68480 [Naegleria gruberi]EFC43493.1 predicted protein [Naegleria gruberi]|eukprot:XP_002676237.1 predicted protein [Naegleria gruberi strain NEG-M]